MTRNPPFSFLLSPFSGGIALGLWILAGLAFLLAAVFPFSAGSGIAGPVLLALAAGWTAVATSGGAGEQESERKTSTLPRFHASALLIGVLVALAIALTIIRDGDRRSFWYVAGVALVALTLARGH